MLTVERFVASQRELLRLEQDEEASQSRDVLLQRSAKELEKEGVCVTKLTLLSITTGLYGRRVVKLVREDLPNHSFSSGDIAGLCHKTLKVICEGIVTKVGKERICVAFEEVPEEATNVTKLCLLKLSNTVTYKRYLSCLKQIEKQESDLVDRLLTDQIKLSHPTTQPIEIKYSNSSLNAGQRSAVSLSLARSDLAVIHGPPGTGKTTTIVEVVRQHVALGDAVLVCAPSNIAVDNLLLKLAPCCSVVRLGHPARVNSALQHHSLDAKLKLLDEDNILQDVRNDIDQLVRGNHGNKDKNIYGSRKGLGELKRELRERGQKAVKEVLTSSQVVLCTLTSAGREGPLGKLPDNHFSVCVIDEASQALEIACWMGMLNCKKTILAGDHLQLPPTIKSDKAAKEGLSATLMERLLKQLQAPSSVSVILTEQYRMNREIMEWSSDELYEGKLTAHSSVEDHVLSDLAHVSQTDLTRTPLCYIDTAGAGLGECHVGLSRGNCGEARLVLEYLSELKDTGLHEHEMAVITPYNLQIDLIKQELGGLFGGVEVCTVDGFQGREKEVIIISMVRSNADGDIGFLKEARRMNVAVTRARRHVCLIGDSMTVNKDPFLGRLVAYFAEHGVVRSAFEFGLHFETDAVVVHKEEEEDEQKEPTQNEVLPPSSVKQPTFKELALKSLTDFKEAPKDKAKLKFPGLNSYQRRIIHDHCEKLGLFSQSSGSASERVLEVSETNFETKGLDDHEEHCDSLPRPSVNQTSQGSEPREETPAVQDKLSVCHQCGKRVPGPNLPLHMLHCKPKTFTTPAPTPKPGKSANKKKKKAPKPGPPGPPPSDLEVLDQGISERLRCPISGCPLPAPSYMEPCRFCSRCLCSDHRFPEAHGCGEAARRAAHAPPRAHSARQHVQSKSRLKQALQEKEKARTKKKK